MKILALECSHPKASLCLSHGSAILSEACWEAARNHDSYLFPALQQALSVPGSEALDYILVGAGPGSYGGVRVALAAAVGIATVKGARVVAIGSWDDLATDGSAIVSDARRGGWTIRRANGKIEVLTPAQLQGEIAQGLKVASIENEDVLKKAGLTIERAGLVPTAQGLVRSWLALTPEQQAACAATPAEPIYVRPPHITEAKHKPWEIKS